MSRERDLDWAGMYNVRDLGGLPTRRGGTTRWGAIVRSEGLDRLDPEGWQSLRSHGVRTCIDLRSSFERDGRPYEGGGSGVAIVWEPMEGLLDDAEFCGWAEGGLLSTALYYGRFSTVGRNGRFGDGGDRDGRGRRGADPLPARTRSHRPHLCCTLRVAADLHVDGLRAPTVGAGKVTE